MWPLSPSAAHFCRLCRQRSARKQLISLEMQAMTDCRPLSPYRLHQPLPDMTLKASLPCTSKFSYLCNNGPDWHRHVTCDKAKGRSDADAAGVSAICASSCQVVSRLAEQACSIFDPDRAVGEAAVVVGGRRIESHI